MTAPGTPPNGPHLAFPFSVGRDGRSARVESLPQHVRDELLQLLLTNPGERPMRPEFGGGVRRMVFEGLDDSTAAMAKARISQALTRWLGDRLTLEDLTVEASDTTLSVDLVYRIAGEEDSRRMRFQKDGA